MTAPSARVSERIGSIAESATLAVDAKAKALKAEGEDVIGFGAGEPDFPTPENIVDAAVEAARDPRFHRYSPAAGLPALREAIAEKTSRDSGFAVEAANVLVTNGGKQAVFNTFAALLDPGDEVLLPAPYWTTYPESVKLAGGVPVDVFAGPEQGYRVTVDQLEEAVTERTKVLVFVSPSNPTGAVHSPEQVAEIGRWAAQKGLWVVTDEIYEQLTYDGVPFTSVASLTELADQVVVLSGVAKTYAMTGWRVGWMVGPQDLIKAASNLQSHATSNVANVSQMAALEALTGPQDAVARMREAFDRRRRAMVEGLDAVAGFSCPTPEGAFYAYVDVRGALGREVGGTTPQTSAELAEVILEQAKVAVVPGEAFGPSGYLRLSYALGDDDLHRGLDRIADLLGRG
ncbi:MAG: pyridoxal phosphate-dependent aminotransferase [Nesterenkonia sp.]|uniref:pyridoxal phosphate-dependent aminotransferase n=1 Tax=Nesterenkonia marinintestina TaxID=2979865 RepID=UPI0021C1F6E3|nr:pyridoxal phosphate-dependent aminotransferase [Nesterenkonia sp. GX14115]MDO5492677.1 pyridoxal phosphate-dependent aminotransferase [Nesterenkonia sp.]